MNKIKCTEIWDPSWQADEKLQWAKKNQHVCILPFTNLGINVEFDGQRSPAKQKTYLRKSCCCNLIADSDKTTIDQVKQSVIHGQLDLHCQRCYDSEQQTGSSERTMALISKSSEHFNKFLNSSEVDDCVLSIKFSNLCNLACRSCSPTFSSKYAQVHQLTIPQELFDDISNTPSVWLDITSTIEQRLLKNPAIALSLFGGETLIQPGAKRLFTWLSENSLLGRVKLQITTNLTNLDTSIYNQFTQFQHVHLCASIDSIEENFSYVRWPGKWNQIQENLNKILPEIQKGKILLTIQPLWNLNNIFYIIDYLDWWLSWFESNNIAQVSIKNVTMFRPFHMTIQNLPLEYRNELNKLLKQAVSHAVFKNKQHDSFKHFLLGMIDFLSNKQEIYDQFELFLYDTAKHDCANQTQMQVGNKRFYDILSTKHQQLLQEFQKSSNLKILPIKQQVIYQQLPL